MAHLLLLGPPGSGKGTQGPRLAAAFGVVHIDAGELVRQHARAETPAGLAAMPYLIRREPLPDEIMTAMLGQRLLDASARGGFVLDGFPRRLSVLDWLARQPYTLDAVLFLDVTRDECERRIAARQRNANDSGGNLRRRFELFESSTMAVIRAYSGLGLLRRVDGCASVDVVTERLLAQCDGLCPTPGRRAPGR